MIIDWVVDQDALQLVHRGPSVVALSVCMCHREKSSGHPSRAPSGAGRRLPRSPHPPARDGTSPCLAPPRTGPKGPATRRDRAHCCEDSAGPEAPTRCARLCDSRVDGQNGRRDKRSSIMTIHLAARRQDHGMTKDNRRKPPGSTERRRRVSKRNRPEGFLYSARLFARRSGLLGPD